MREPILGKRPPTKRDYRLITWRRFLSLRGWAKTVAEKYHASVYLVGSALQKTMPRDVDIAIVLPLDELGKRFTFPENFDPTNDLHVQTWMKLLRDDIADDVSDAYVATRGRYTLDIKVCPDFWWPEKDRLLLAAPPSESEAL